MESNYESKYSGEQIDAAVEYFLRHSQTEESSYEYSNTIFCESASGFPALPFNNSSLPCTLPEFPFAGIDGNLWRDIPNTSSKDWYQCVIKLNNKTGKVVSQGSVMDMTGATGPAGNNGSNGTDGRNGTDGTDGKSGKFTEFRYKRSSSYAITLTPTQQNTREPEGWVTDWNLASVEPYSTIQDECVSTFDTYLRAFSSKWSSSSDKDKFITELSPLATWTEIDNMFYSIYSEHLVANSIQQTKIINCHKAFKDLYDDCGNGTVTALIGNDRYHSIYKEYIDNDHFWALFQTSATIDGDTGYLLTGWTQPNRISGVDGKPGPKGSNGIDGIPGVNIAVAFTLGTKDSYRPDAAIPTMSPYNTNYNALYAVGTNWQKSLPTVSDTYPYIWFTQCRYIVSKDANGNDIYKFEDAWSVPQRYTGLNGITTVETVYVKNPIIYPAGIFDATKTYQNTGTAAPYVYFDGYYYYMSGQGTYIGSDTSNPSNSSQYWTKMESFEAIFAKVGIIANGLIGSAVFNGDYMFSQRGLAYDGTEVAGKTSYEKFLTHYATGATLTDPYDDNAAFKPYICINFATGEFWSNSVNAKVASTASGISIQMKEDVINQIQAAGVDISSGKVKVTGEFEGTANGTFNGEVKASAFAVIDEDGQESLKFTNYDPAMGTLPDGITLDPGTPIMVVNYGGVQYVSSMVALSHGINSSLNYVKQDMTTSSILIATTINRSMSDQGSTYNCITKAPYLIVRNNSTDTGQTIIATLKDSSGNQVAWSTVYNRYYSGNCPVELDPVNTNINNGVLVYKITGTFLTASERYLGSHRNFTLAMYTSPVYYGRQVYGFERIDINNGIISHTNRYILVGKTYTVTRKTYTSSEPLK